MSGNLLRDSRVELRRIDNAMIPHNRRCSHPVTVTISYWPASLPLQFACFLPIPRQPLDDKNDRKPRQDESDGFTKIAIKLLRQNIHL